MDGVITNTMPYHFEAWKKVLSGIGVHVKRYDVYKREGQPGWETIAEWCAEYAYPLDTRKQKALLEAKEELFKRIVKIKFVPTAKTFLRNLKKRTFLLGLVTGTSHKEVKKILHESLYAMFDVIVTSDEVVRGKPNPEPFLQAIRKLKISKREAVVIENAPFGIEAAKKAGLRCLAVETSLPARFLTEADAVFTSVERLQQKVHFEKTGA